MATYTDVDDSFIASYQTKFNFLIITATEIEKQVLHEHLKPLPGKKDILRIHKQKHTYFVGVFGAFYVVHVGCNEMGSLGRNASMVTTSDAINHWQPTVVLMVGIAFGINKKKQQIGDILVSERILSYEPQRIGKKEVLHRGKEGTASSLLYDRFRSVTGWTFEQDGRIPEIIGGLILSGEKLIDNPAFKKQLVADHPEAKGGEMEGVGVYAACDQKVNDWILVKAICDYGDGNKGQDKDKNQRKATESAVKLCELVFNAKFAFKDIGLVFQDEVLLTDGSEQKGPIPEWMRKQAKSLAKQIRNED